MAAHDISCISCLGYNEKGFRAVKQNVPPTVLSGDRVKRKKESEKKENAAPQFEIQTPVCPFYPSRQKFRRVSGREIENTGYAKISLFSGQGYDWQYMNCKSPFRLAHSLLCVSGGKLQTLRKS